MTETENPYVKIIENLEKNIKEENERLDKMKTIYLKQIAWYARLIDAAGSSKLHYTPYVHIEIPSYMDDLEKYDIKSNYKRECKENLKKLIEDMNSTGSHINDLREDLELNRKRMEYYGAIMKIEDEKLRGTMFKLMYDISADDRILSDLLLKISERTKGK